jgi:hypothetical protein
MTSFLYSTDYTEKVRFREKPPVEYRRFLIQQGFQFNGRGEWVRFAGSSGEFQPGDLGQLIFPHVLAQGVEA